MDAGALDPASLGIGLVGAVVTLAGIWLLRPSDADAAGRSESGAGAATERHTRTGP